MGFINNPRIVTDGLVLHLDAANMKSYDKYENLLTNSQLGINKLTYGTTTSTDTTIANPFGRYDGVVKCTHTTNTPGYFRRGGTYALVSGSTYTFSYYFKNDSISNPFGPASANDPWLGNHGSMNPGYMSTSVHAGVGEGSGPTFQTIWQFVNTDNPVGNEWYRQVLTFAPSYTQNYSLVFSLGAPQNPVGSFYLYGFQLEEGSTVTDYYETTTTVKSRSTTWLDMNGNGNNGTLVNGVGYNSGNGGSLSFDGSNDYITVSNVQPNTNNFTISVWILKNNNTSNDYVWDFGADGGTLSAGTNIGGLGFRYYNSTLGVGSNMYTQGTIPNVNEWYEVTITRNNGTSTMYVNGQSITSSSGDTHNISSTTLYIGRYGGGTGYEHDGRMSNFKIYNRALTASEVKQNFNALRGRFDI